MIKTKCFKLGDYEGINELLGKHPISKGASIFISNGDILIPYDDGEFASDAMRIMRIKELRNTEFDKLVTLKHDQRVAEVKSSGIKKQLENLEEKLEKASKIEEKKIRYDEEKTIKEEIKRLDNVLAQTNNQRLMTQAEITNVMTSIAVYDEDIYDLENPPEVTDVKH